MASFAPDTALRNITLRQMRAFSTVARAGSFTAAARQMNLTQSAVSMLVQQLEDDLGVRLFDRTRAAVTLTEAGGQLLPLARRILDDVRQVVDGALDLRSLKRGMLRVVAPQLLACTWMAGVLAKFERAHPDVGLKLLDATADDIVSTVRRGEVELGIGPERPTGDDVTRTLLMHVPMRLVCSKRHPLARRRFVTWRELGQQRWVMYSSDFNRYLEQLLHTYDAQLAIETVTEVGYLTTALALVGSGLGVSAVPDYARSFAPNFDLVFLPLREPEVNREFFVYQRRGMTLSPAAEAFAEMMRARAT